MEKESFVQEVKMESYFWQFIISVSRCTCINFFFFNIIIDGKETKSHAIRIFSPITSVLIFQPRTSSHPDDELHLVVTCAIEQAIVYRSIETDALSTSRTLPLSGNFDSVLCSHVMDVDWDGEKEILIGTYGRQVLIYKQGIKSRVG
jgi:hypothetical protein